MAYGEKVSSCDSLMRSYVSVRLGIAGNGQKAWWDL